MDSPNPPVPLARLRRLGGLLREPIPAEMRALLAERWQSLPAELRTDRQALGRHYTHCGYTLGASFCSFGCTHCYLPKNANRTPIPSFEAMKAQIDANRRLLGPGGGLQITGGDVVDAYWKADRAGELVAIVRHAVDAGLAPMLMTHGQVLLEQPDYFLRLVKEGGLRKVAFHIDVTQAGRPGFPIRELDGEADLHPLRERFVDLVLGVRKASGVRFYAAHTVTVTEANHQAGVAEVVRWLVAEPRRLDAFRMVSFQTEADVGRTRFSARPVTPETTWAGVCEGAGLELPRDSFWYGHPDCSSVVTLLVDHDGGRVVNLVPTDAASRAFWSELLDLYGGLAGHSGRTAEAFLRKAAVLAWRPVFLARAARYARTRLRDEGLGAPFAIRFLRGRVRALNVVMHNFMHAEQLAEPRSERVAARLAACSFRGAVRRGEDWTEVSMCTMNAAEREAIYERQIAAGG